MLAGHVRLSVGLVAAQQAAGRYPVRRPTEWQQAVPTANESSGGRHFGNGPEAVLWRLDIRSAGYNRSQRVQGHGSLSAAHRRLLIEYATGPSLAMVSAPNDELVNAYAVRSVTYMLMTSSNAPSLTPGEEKVTWWKTLSISFASGRRC